MVQNATKARTSSSNGQPQSALEYALLYAQSGLSPLPIKADCSKAPDGSWKSCQAKIWSEKRIRSRFSDPTVGVANAYGNVSGHAELIDFDDGKTRKAYFLAMEEKLPGLLDRLTFVETPRGDGAGHLIYRCPDIDIPGSRKLATRENPDWVEGCKLSRYKTLVETKGEGGYALAPGCPPGCHETGNLYKHTSGPALTSLAVITPEERQILIDTAIEFDEVVPEPTFRFDNSYVRKEDTGGTAGSAYNLSDEAIPETLAMLLDEGWTEDHRHKDLIYLTRPGKSCGVSATLGKRSEKGIPLFIVFTDSAPKFRGACKKGPSTSFTPFAALAILKHDGSFKATASWLYGQGYGRPRPEDEFEPIHLNPAGQMRVGIRLTPEDFVINQQVQDAMAADEGLFNQEGKIVHVLEIEKGKEKESGVTRAVGQPVIRNMPPSITADRMTQYIGFTKMFQEGPKMVRPPKYVIDAFLERGQWDHIPVIQGVATSPLLRQDGSIAWEKGFDKETGLYIDCGSLRMDVPAKPTLDEAIKAMGLLTDLFIDFPFETPQDLAAIICGTLTPMAKQAYDGPSPMFLTEANTPGSGKTLLVDIISTISQGRAAAVTAYTTDESELRKKITALILAGDPMVHFDNISGDFGGPTIDMLLTAEFWKDRILNTNTNTDMQTNLLVYGSGNNVKLVGTVSRRILPIKIMTDMEFPEQRTGFKYDPIKAYVLANRARLMSAAFTILRGYFVAGCPDMGLEAWGSFQGWTAIVRNAVVWAGLEDPRTKPRDEQIDEDLEALRGICYCWPGIADYGEYLTTRQIIDKIMFSTEGRDAKLQEALGEILNNYCKAGARGMINAKSLGRRLRVIRGRLAGDKKLFGRVNGHLNIWEWTVAKPKKK